MVYPVSGGRKRVSEAPSIIYLPYLPTIHICTNITPKIFFVIIIFFCVCVCVYIKTITVAVLIDGTESVLLPGPAPAG